MIVKVADTVFADAPEVIILIKSPSFTAFNAVGSDESISPAPDPE